MSEIPFTIEWSIDENELLPSKDTFNGYLKSASFSNIPEFEYYLKLYPNRNREECREETWIFLCLKFKNVQKVEADYTYTIESANYSHIFHDIYEKSQAYGTQICKTNEFFDAEKKFIVDGKLTVKVNGIFKFERIDDAIPAVIQEQFIHEQQKWSGGELGDDLWKKDGTKNFTIITADGKEIKVHKFILENRSEILKEMLESKSIEIPDFSFNVVETAFKIIYSCRFDTSLSIDELMQLLQFFNQYELQAFKAKVEPLLINQISASTVVRLVNCSIFTNSINLNEKCIEFLMASFESKTQLADIEIIDKNIALQILQNFLQQNVVPTEITAVMDNEQKWEGGELGDELWERNDNKDCTIVIDGNKIKVHSLVIGTRSKIFDVISEANENDVEIIDFSFNVVETALKLIYHCNFTTKLSMEELMQLQHFFDKYQLPALKAKVEPLLIDQISASTIVRLTNCSILTNSIKLKEKCMDFLMGAFESKTALADIDDLDKNVALQILKNFLSFQIQQ